MRVRFSIGRSFDSCLRAALGGPVDAEAAGASAPFSIFGGPSVVGGVRQDQRDDEEVELSFLQPSERPDMLGRLAHYEVIEVLGQGGFGVVLRAFDETLRRVVAIKVLRPSLAVTSPARKRFLREARAAASVRHENVVTIYAVQEAPIPYLVMECIEGHSLQEQLDQTGPLELKDVLQIGQQIASGLAAAHAKEFVHRDIKPANVMLEGGTGQVKITDFGLARTADDANVTQSGVIIGTPLYMSPEQALGGTIDQRSDLFSLGSVLYAACSGRAPFRAPSTLAVLKRLTEDTPRPIREIIPEVPEWFCAIVAKLQAKNPADRYATAIEVADLLARCLSDLKQHGALQSPSEPRKQPGRGMSWNKRKAVWGVGGVLLLGMSGVLLPLLAASRGPRPDDETLARKIAALGGAPFKPGQDAILVPKPNQNLLPDRWYDLLGVIPASGAWTKTSDGLFQFPVIENRVIEVPVEISGDYQLSSSFTRKSGARSVNYYFPVSERVGVLRLDREHVDTLLDGGESGPASLVQTAALPLETGRRYEVAIKVAVRGDNATLEVKLDGKPRLEWTGPRASLAGGTSSGRFALGSRDGDTVFHSLRLRLEGGQARLK